MNLCLVANRRNFLKQLGVLAAISVVPELKADEGKPVFNQKILQDRINKITVTRKQYKITDHVAEDIVWYTYSNSLPVVEAHRRLNF